MVSDKARLKAMVAFQLRLLKEEKTKKISLAMGFLRFRKERTTIRTIGAARLSIQINADYKLS